MRIYAHAKINKLEACELYRSGWTGYEIASKYHCDRAAVYRVLAQAGVVSRPTDTRKHPVDKSYFKIINTEEKAYWLGFLQADGRVPTKKPWTIHIGLQTQDINHLNKFAKSVGSDKKASIRHQKIYDYALLQIHSKELIIDLINKGFADFNRTGAITILSHIPINLQRHWLRGFFDGDGWLTKKKYVNSDGLQFKSDQHVFGVCSPHQSILKAIETILITAGAVNHINKHMKIKSIYALIYGGNQQIKHILEWLYADATVYLDRKKIKADVLINNK